MAGRAQLGHWRGLLAGLGVAAALALSPDASAQIIEKEPPPAVRGLDLAPKMGEQIPLDLAFTDSTGRKVPLSSYFNDGGKPVLLALVYYNCPMMCPLMLSRIQDRVNNVAFQIGHDYNVVVISFDPLNTAAMAAQKKAEALAGYGKDIKAAERGWTFHVSDAVTVKTLADAVGFPYRYLPENGQYSHTAALTVLTPQGRVSGYIDGLGQDTGELRLALLQASEGKIAKTIGDFFLHRCYRYDPATGAYVFQAMRVMQVGGLLTVIALTSLIVGLRAWERGRRARRERAMATVDGLGGKGMAMGHTA